MKNRIALLALVVSLLSPALLHAQAKKFPKDLKQLTMKEVMDLGRVDMQNLPVYNIEGDLLKPEDAGKAMSSGNFRPEYFANASGKLSAIKLRKITEEEIAMFQRFAEEQKRMAALIGTEAKGFETVDMDGNPVNLADMRGSVVAINFWFIGCKPCIMEMPELNEIVHKFEGENVKFVAIATDKKSALAKFQQKREFNYNIVPEGRDLSKLYEISGYPTHCIVDQEGKIAYFKSAYSERTAAELTATITKLLNK